MKRIAWRFGATPLLLAGLAVRERFWTPREAPADPLAGYRVDQTKCLFADSMRSEPDHPNQSAR